MASLPRSTSSTSIHESPEHTTMRECHVVLVDLLKSSIGSLGDALFARGVIPPDVKDYIHESTTTKVSAVRHVVSYLTTQIKYSPTVYLEFLAVLREQGPWTNTVVEKLTSRYESQIASPESSLMSVEGESSESQSKFHLEFTVPQNCPRPQEVINSLSSVHLSVFHEDQNKSKKTIMDTQLSAGKNNTWGQQATPASRGLQSEWSEELGRRDILFLVTKVYYSEPGIVPRRSRDCLTKLERRKLEELGIHEDLCLNDLSIMKERSGLDKRSSVANILSGEKITCEEVKRQIAELMKYTDKEEVVLHYIGPGESGTGDWILRDGFISFREIMDIYTQHFRGRVLTIVSDCSYSGNWVREAMTFLDEQGVGPCGHVAKKKGMLVKVFASCLANEIPAELAFSAHGIMNKENTGTLSFTVVNYRGDEIHDDQHPCGLDFTEIRCNKTFQSPCTMAPGSTWEKWMTGVVLARGEDRGRDTWHYVMVKDRQAVDTGSIDASKLGDILECGWGKDPPDDVKERVTKQYQVDYSYNPF